MNFSPHKLSSSALLISAAALLSAVPAAADDVSGFLYGTVVTKGGTSHTGVIRWGNEEAFWDDHFNGTKKSEPATGEFPEGYRQPERHKVEVFGLEISGPWDRGWDQRQIAVRFGDLAEIRPLGDDKAEITLRSGRKLEIEGGSNDFGAEVAIADGTLGDVEVDWRRIESVRFAATPAGAKVPGRRLRAKVKTTVGDFAGWLAWDGQESVTHDKLDGDTDDGDLSIEMGKIRAIERRSRDSARVELADGRKLELSGSNDVDHSIRGILVEDPRFGRVEIPWEVFVRADIEASDSSGPGYGDYPARGALRAKVTTTDGRALAGEIAFDLDETEAWEMVDGIKDDVEYNVPFHRIREIRTLSRKRVDLHLDGGERLALEGQTDVDESNAGIAFLGRTGADAYVPWDKVSSIVFE